MAKINIPDIATQFASATALNSRFQQVEDALNNLVLYRDNPEGEANEMVTDLDMDYNRIYNLPAATSSGQPVTFGQVLSIVTDLLAGGDGTGGSLTYVNEYVTLTSGQTLVTFSSDLTLANFYVSSLGTDGKTLVADTDYDLDIPARSITLYNSYPAGTVIRAKVEVTDETVPLEGVATVADRAGAKLNYADVDGTGAVVLDCLNGDVSLFNITLTGVVTDVSVTNTPTDTDKSFAITLRIISDGASGVTFGSQFQWAGGAAPTLSAVSGDRDYITALTIDNGTTYDGWLTAGEVG